MPHDLEHASLRLSDLQRSHAADATLKNLLDTLTGQIQACAKLAVFEYEADSEGHEALASAFHELADIERAAFNRLLEDLRRHLNELSLQAPPPPVHRTPTQAANR